MESVGFISLAGQLFSGSLKLYDIYVRRQGAGKTYQRQTTLLSIQECRYRNWGTTFGLDKGVFNGQENLKPYQCDLILDILAGISDVLMEASDLDKRYASPSKPSEGSSTSLAPEINALAITDRQLQSRKRAHELKSRIATSIRFVLRDEAKIEKFIETLASFNDGLDELTASHTRNMYAMLCTQLLATNTTVDLLGLASATESTDTTISELANRKARNIEISGQQPSVVGMKELYLDSKTSLQLDEVDITVTSSSKSTGREFGTYQLTTPVMLEWKMASEDASESDLLQRAFDVASFLSAPSKEKTHLQRCMGYFTRPGETRRVALVYQVGSGKHRALSETIEAGDMDHISLGTRHRLALELAESVFYLHLTGWLHKSIRSDNLLISTHNSDKNTVAPSLGPQLSLTLVGFNTSRLDQQGEASEKIEQGNVANLYQHPDYQGGSWMTPYLRSYDIYSLGVCLLEIGLWQPIREIGGYKPNKHSATSFSNKLKKESVMGSLDFTVGTPYRRAVEWCLKGQFEVGEDGQVFATKPSEGQMLEFSDRVVSELAKCSVPE
ncbi:hypothetical protein EDB81DRAFT_925477 [Dactylonectria macrodidyma]|uniref:Protein kinase domain-containing protein n=1 Tax=Dactylonectria macrodidyma TaxID=307937 RepID=A0A9P9FHX4_9HYPO|nr:hypothetical protein EDB81DRAFT_925477 [Dactylonectria macrodidyma]